MRFEVTLISSKNAEDERKVLIESASYGDAISKAAAEYQGFAPKEAKQLDFIFKMLVLVGPQNSVRVDAVGADGDSAVENMRRANPQYANARVSAVYPLSPDEPTLLQIDTEDSKKKKKKIDDQ